MPRTVTLPFFLDQVRFKDKDVIQKSKYMLFFVTEVIKLRPNGMEPHIIVERLFDRVVPIAPKKIQEIVKEITEEFDKCVAKGELTYHPRIRENGTTDHHAAYGFRGEKRRRQARIERFPHPLDTR